MGRLLSLAAGVQPDVAPADMVSVASVAGWPAVGIWFDGKTWSDTTSREVRTRLDDTGVIALDIEPVIPSKDGNDFAEKLIEAAAVIGARHILFTSRLKDQVRTTDRYQRISGNNRNDRRLLPCFGCASSPVANGARAFQRLHLYTQAQWL